MPPPANNAAPDAAVQILANLNLELLLELRALIEPLTPAQYQEVHAPLESSIGAHIRHIVECYEQFAKHSASGTLSYDRRARCQDLEGQPEIAIQRIDQVCQNLRALEQDRPLQLDHVTAQDSNVASQSSLGRELAHLIDHATHHLAMVDVAGKLAQIPLPPELGYSVATLQHLRNQNYLDDAISSNA
ncbi:MAG: DinB family protein [Pseudomonadales bacterium]